jgi:hypothetical protein
VKTRFWSPNNALDACVSSSSSSFSLVSCSFFVLKRRTEVKTRFWSPKTRLMRAPRSYVSLPGLP